jgi:hypothetical protein
MPSTLANMPRTSRLFILLLLVFKVGSVVAQQEVTVRGRAISANDPQHSFYGLMVVNKRTRSGTFGQPDGTFEVRAMRTDTLLVGSAGHKMALFCLRDSAERSIYEFTVVLKPVAIELKTVTVLPERTMREIQADINKLGYDPKEFQTQGVDAFQSPITAIYQAFSKRERSKRLVAEMRNDDRRRYLLRELLGKYVEYDIINLSNESFDDFIDFCAVSDTVIKGLTQYEFLLYVKKKYELYTSLGPTRMH